MEQITKATSTKFINEQIKVHEYNSYPFISNVNPSFERSTRNRRTSQRTIEGDSPARSMLTHDQNSANTSKDHMVCELKLKNRISSSFLSVAFSIELTTWAGYQIDWLGDPTARTHCLHCVWWDFGDIWSLYGWSCRNYRPQVHNMSACCCGLDSNPLEPHCTELVSACMQMQCIYWRWWLSESKRDGFFNGLYWPA